MTEIEETVICCLAPKNIVLFWSGSRWSREYPDAMLFRSLGLAEAVLRHLGLGFPVTAYGMYNEQWHGSGEELQQRQGGA